ncbi:MAG: endopeptidase La [Immundisolibacter sp.]|uniref:endopeptidase La n=1 Tax=Immundisolibacter sp. TaxID=1934948 RepID=UPI001988700A|nr:endopeptidase La [Immundisolibacter sp.]MBC7160529.1 endopeptidase La [Immundisolibacter sp.]
MTDRKHKRSDADSDSLTLPVLPLRDVVVFPHMVIPLFVGREKSITALELSDAHDKRIFLAAQKDAGMDDPKADDIYTAGTVAHVLQMLKLPDGTVKVLVEGISRASVTEWSQRDGCFMAKLAIPQAAEVDPKEDTVLQRSVLEQFEQYVRGSKKIPPEALTALAEISDSSRLADTIAAHLPVRLPKKQELLEIVDVVPRLEHLLHLLETEIDLLQVEKRMRGRVKRQMEKSQREYYLNEQMRAIQKELGELEDGGNDLDELERRIEAAGPPKAVLAKARSELAKLRMMSPMAAEATVVRNYLDWIVQLPWRTRSRVRRDLDQAQQVLERDHYGLEKVKERILEYLAVQQRVRKLKGPILCLVGPPGVGKTSLGRSIANATGRKFARMSLGGVRDEAEIRGHRRTYIGSMPGKVLQNLAKVGTRNPVFMLDEVDKMAMDFRGDPASALLEVLDPEQNHAFNDHYLEVDYDLSDVLFVATANTLNIPAPLLDRMEVIRLAGYTEDEKLNIAKRYLVPKALTDNGLKDTEIAFSDEALRAIIQLYTREAGVRNLEREINKVCRKAVRQAVQKTRKGKLRITDKNLGEFLGVQRYRPGLADTQNRIGQVTGLAWTEVGGELLTVEAAVVPGKGGLTLTGQLGEVMQESVKAALTVVRSRASQLGITAESFQQNDFHLHVPEGAIPKDGPSAGVAMVTALTSALSGIPVRADVAMTGEITLRGEVLAIGGLKEKLLAALRGGIVKVLIPKDNEKDLADVPEDVKQRLDIQPVQWIDEVFEHALTALPGAVSVPVTATDTPPAPAESYIAH